MKNVTRGSQAIRSTSEEKVEVKTVVAGVTYTEEEIDYISATRLLFAGEKPAIGGCVAAQLDLDLWKGSSITIPRAAMIRPFVRVVGGDEQDGDWIPAGVFWIDTREEDGDFTSIHAYDTMLKAEERFLAEGDTGAWPRTMATVVGQICTRMGVELDPRTTLNPVYPIDYPNDYTMRELLSFVGTANGGNWVITDEGKLRLIRLGDIPAETYFLVDEEGSPVQMGDNLILAETPPETAAPDHSTGVTGKIYVGPDVDDFYAAPAFDPVSRVTIWIDDDTFVTAGDDSGYAIEADCPWATQAMANNVLEQLRGYVYRPYSASGASIPPAAELGDGVTSCGVYSVIASIETDFNALYTADISAPAEQEIDHEYPYQSKMQRELARKVALGKSYYGTRIDRQRGLQIIKVNQDGSESNRVQLNSDVLAFYDATGQPMLYFDAVKGKYVFKGVIEVAQGDMTYGDGNELVLVRFSTDKTAVVPTGWSTTWNSVWENSNTEVWAIYSYNGGETWRTPVLVQGKTGAQGPPGDDGSDADIPAWVSAYTASARYNTLISGEWVIAMNLYGSRIFAGSQDNEYAEMTANGWKLFDASDLLKIHLGLESGNDYDTPFVRLGAGDSQSGISRAGLIEKFGRGLWLGSSDAMGAQDEPISGTGFWIDFLNDHIYRVIDGEKTDITDAAGGGQVTAVWG